MSVHQSLVHKMGELVMKRHQYGSQAYQDHQFKYGQMVTDALYKRMDKQGKKLKGQQKGQYAHELNYFSMGSAFA